VSKITHAIDLSVNVGGVWHKISTTVPGRIASGVRSRDWETRKRAHGYLFCRFKDKLAEQLGMPAIPYRVEEQIDIRNIRVLTREERAEKKPTNIPPKKKSKIPADQMTLMDHPNWPGDV
jgi:hypothetical protein